MEDSRYASQFSHGSKIVAVHTRDFVVMSFGFVSSFELISSIFSPERSPCLCTFFKMFNNFFSESKCTCIVSLTHTLENSGSILHVNIYTQ